MNLARWRRIPGYLPEARAWRAWRDRNPDEVYEWMFIVALRDGNGVTLSVKCPGGVGGAPKGTCHFSRQLIHVESMDLLTRFATNVRRLREKKKFSQKALADKVGISVSYVSMLERGQRSPPLETIEKMAKALGVPPASLLAGR